MFKLNDNNIIHNQQIILIRLIIPLIILSIKFPNFISKIKSIIIIRLLNKMINRILIKINKIDKIDKINKLIRMFMLQKISQCKSKIQYIM